LDPGQVGGVQSLTAQELSNWSLCPLCFKKDLISQTSKEKSPAEGVTD
jgi:hypothetical protein